MVKKNAVSRVPGDPEQGGTFARAILDFLSRIPTSKESRSTDPAKRLREIASKAARSAAATAGTLALPVGSLGWLTILPELVAVWRIQAQMVADIAGCYGKTKFLSREQMLYCLFKHGGAQAVRDLVVRAGERMLIKKASLRVLQRVARRVGIRVSQRSIGKGISRFLPVIGAVGVGAYAYFDTAQVAKTAKEFFEQDLVLEPEARESE